MLHQDSYRMLRPVPFSCCLPCCLPFCLPRCLPLLPAHCANAAPPSSASSGALATLANYEGLASASDDLRTKCSRALKGIITHLSHLPALDALVRRPLPEAVMKVVLQQVGVLVSKCAQPIQRQHIPRPYLYISCQPSPIIAAAAAEPDPSPLLALQVGHVLSSDPTGRTAFVQSGGLAAVLAMAESSSALKEASEAIAGAFVCFCSCRPAASQQASCHRSASG
jgi:hypothetical protein